MDPNHIDGVVDIFRDLDTDLSEIFTRSQQDEIRRLTNRLRQHHETHERYVHLYWLWFLPLPVVNYALIWRRNRPANLAQTALRAFLAISTMVVRLSRFLAYLAFTGHWLRDVIKFMLVYCSLVTFSENFFVDIVTYIFRNSESLLERRNQLQNTDFFPQLDGSAIPNWLFWWTVASNSVALLLRMKCEISAEFPEQGACQIDRNALIFRFSEASMVVFPALKTVPLPVLTAFTVLLYVVYGLGGQFLCFNVLLFWLINTMRRTYPALDFMGKLSKVLWYGGSTVF